MMSETGTALWRLSASAGRAAVTAGDVTVEGLVTSQLARIKDREEEIKAWAYLDPEGAVATARRLDGAGEAMALRGVTVGVKDVIDTADMPTAYNSPIYRDHRPAVDAACVTRLRAAGAVILGKTETTEFAHAQPARTTNPHNREHTPGGSSSGSAAAVADGMVATAIGTQTGGSTIRPGAFCGVFAMKPSFGSIDTAGVKPLATSLDTVGLFGRRVGDLRLLLVVLAEGDVEPAPRDYAVAVCRTEAWDRAEAAAQAAVDGAAAALRAQGVAVRELVLPVPLAEFDRMHQTIMAFETAAAFAAEWRDHQELLSDGFAAFIAKGQAISRADYDDALGDAAEARLVVENEIGDDVVLTPSVVGEAPRGLASTGDPVFNRMWTLLHVPCVQVPWGHGPKGLPIGVQLVGRRGGDEAVLAAARDLHQAAIDGAGDITKEL